MKTTYNEKELAEWVSKTYGFLKELVKELELCGLWHVRFQVNGVKYYGSIPYYGALPTLSVEGYATNKYYHGTPVEDWYYREYIEGKKFRVFRCDENGNCEDTGICFESQEEAEAYVTDSKFLTYEVE